MLIQFCTEFAGFDTRVLAHSIEAFASIELFRASWAAPHKREVYVFLILLLFIDPLKLFLVPRVMPSHVDLEISQKFLWHLISSVILLYSAFVNSQIIVISCFRVKFDPGIEVVLCLY